MPSSKAGRGRRFLTAVAAWRRAWAHVIPFFAFPPAVRRVIYTTDAIESINAWLRKIIETWGTSPATTRRNQSRSSTRTDSPERPRHTGAPTCPPHRSFVASDAGRRGQVFERVAEVAAQF